jgi:hypothetical protein
MEAETAGWDPSLAAGINLSDVDENAGFQPVPKGVYLANVVEATYGLSNNGGNPMITLRYQISDPEQQNSDDGGVNGRNVTQWILLNHAKPDVAKQGLAQLKKTVLALCPEMIEQQFIPQEAPSWFKGRQGRIRVTVRSGRDGQGPMSSVQEVMSPDGPDSSGFFDQS